MVNRVSFSVGCVDITWGNGIMASSWHILFAQTNRREVDIHWANSSAAYMCQWTGSALVQIMACRLFDVKPLHETMLVYCQLDPRGQNSLKFKLKTKLFIHKNAFENVVYEIAAILSREKGVKIINILMCLRLRTSHTPVDVSTFGPSFGITKWTRCPGTPSWLHSRLS